MSEQKKQEESEARELSLEEMDNLSGGATENAGKRNQEQADK